jgi:hypothetical protein
MTKEFVPYELALKLKQLGFDKPCFGYYQYTRLKLQLPILKSETQPQTYMGAEDCSAPLFQQAFRWFREEFYMVGEINSYYADKKWSFNYDIVTIFKEKASDRFNTYEEAELACLDKIIEILETKQQEQ